MPSASTSWGIEVGAGAIKALKLERDGDQIRVADFAVAPHKKVLSTPDLNKDEAIALALGSFMSQYRDALRGSTICVSIPGHSAFARFAKLPPVEKKGIGNLVRFEAVQQIPFPIDEVEWDYQTFADEESPDVEVGIFAVTKAKIAEVLAQYGEQGLTPDVITLSPVAAYNAIAYDLAFTNKSSGTVILDIGTTATDLVVADSGKVWIRTFPLGGHNFTEALATTFKLPYGKAEKLKREADTSKFRRHIFQAIKPVLQELVQDVQRSIAYYRDTHPEANITRVIGVGSTFKLLGLRKLLGQQLKLDVFRFEHCKRLLIEGAPATDFEAATPGMMTAYGLALQGLGLQTINANLIPVQVVRKALWKRKTPWFVAAAGIGIAAGGLSFLRPMLDNMAVQSARADSSITAPIRDTINLGTKLKNEWTTAGQSKQPGFIAENLRRLLEGRDLYPLFLRDLSGIFGSIEAYAKQRGAEAPAVDHPAVLGSFECTYIPPGKPLGLASKAAGGSGTPPARGGQPPATGNTEAETPANAGPSGAVKFTLVFDAPFESRAFLNDSVLAWLRNNANRAGVPYSLTGIPSATDIPTQTIGPKPTPGGTPTPTRGGTPGSPGAPGTPSSPDNADERSGSPPPPPGRPAPGNQPGRPGAETDLEKVAPLPASMKPPLIEGSRSRFTLTWVALLRPPGQEPGAPDAGKASQESDQ